MDEHHEEHQEPFLTILGDPIGPDSIVEIKLIDLLMFAHGVMADHYGHREPGFLADWAIEIARSITKINIEEGR